MRSWVRVVAVAGLVAILGCAVRRTRAVLDIGDTLSEVLLENSNYHGTFIDEITADLGEVLDADGFRQVPEPPAKNSP